MMSNMYICLKCDWKGEEPVIERRCAGVLLAKCCPECGFPHLRTEGNQDIGTLYDPSDQEDDGEQ